MSSPGLRTVTAWLRASRLPSQSYIAPPLLFGQAYHYHQTGQLDLAVLLVVQLFGIFDQLYIVYSNDYADQETDLLNRTSTAFSGGSRVLVDGDLQPRQLRAAIPITAGGCMLCGLILALGFGRWLALPLSALALLLLWAYSYPPLRLSYRGGGELLQMLGVGLVLPCFGYQAQGGSLADFPWAMLWVLLPTHLACAVATALPDEPSDRRSHKRTLVVWFGPRAARAAVVALNLVSLGALTQVSWLGPLDARHTTMLLVPLLATLGQLPLSPSEPGSKKLLARVFLAILVTVSLMLTCSVALLTGVGR